MNETKLVTVISHYGLKGNVILISRYMAGYLGLVNKEKVTVYVGQYNKDLELRISDSLKNENSIRLSAGLTRRMFLRSGSKYGIRCDGSVIHIGPVVGIMAEVFNQTGKPFGGQSYFISQVLMSGRRLGEICFAFSPYSINWNKNIIYGYKYGKNGWRKAVCPLPDVVYPREKAYSYSKLNIRKKLAKKGVKFINPPLIGKWKTHQIIIKNPRLIPYIPETKLVKNSQQINNMINKHRAVYLKPVAGSQGKNIIKIRKQGASNYHYQYQMNNQLHKGSASSLVNLRSSLRRMMGRRKYIIQKQINLIRSKGNILDVRILVQKDSTGSWGITGMACRVGRHGSITSNISTGGSGKKIEGILKRNFASEDQRIEIIESIKFVALEAARTLEDSIGKAGEMGIDIGIDKQGKVWFIEANLRPGRQVFTLIGKKQIRRQSVQSPVLYARYLAGF